MTERASFQYFLSILLVHAMHQDNRSQKNYKFLRRKRPNRLLDHSTFQDRRKEKKYSHQLQ